MTIISKLDDFAPGQEATDDLAADARELSASHHPGRRADDRPRDRRVPIVVRIGALLVVLGIYSAYRQLRVGAGDDVFSRGLPVEPFRHALTVLKVEHALGLDFEHGLQHAFLGYGIVIRFANAYYSWAHQAMTFALVALVLIKAPWRQAWRWVGALLLQLPVALVLFRLYPLMPPRLLDAGAPWGGRILAQHREIRPTGMVDTLVKFHGPWSPGSVALDAFTNQFAAMPSLHCGFALWVGVVWWRWAKGKPWRFVGPLHAALIFFCVVVTGNHYVLDAIAGWSIALLMLGATNRFAGIRGWLRSVGHALRDGYGAGDVVVDADADDVHGDRSRIPSTSANSQ
ncbi:MAG: hypothetical protein JWM34_384 [Ilumatobacteraceae bacterium]|nr:hypothetical protein [Ilumatobacteraceae bacterium]